MAVTAAEIAIVKGKAGLMKPSVGSQVIARVPRGQVSSATLDPGMLKAALKIGFADGGQWEFEVPKIHRRNAEQVVQVLALPVAGASRHDRRGGPPEDRGGRAGGHRDGGRDGGARGGRGGLGDL